MKYQTPNSVNSAGRNDEADHQIARKVQSISFFASVLFCVVAMVITVIGHLS